MSEMKTAVTAIFGNGCFWCTGAVSRKLEGVINLRSGYSGGLIQNPTYGQIGDEDAGHAEALRIDVDPEKISFDKLLEVFWTTHDPTTPHRQRNHLCPQYRHVIFYSGREQKETAEAFKKSLEQNSVFDQPIVRAIEPPKNFYRAENYHQPYYTRHTTQPCCHFYTRPNVATFREVFAESLKPQL